MRLLAFVAVLVLGLMAFPLAALLRVRFEIALPLTFFAAIIWLYLGYVTGVLHQSVFALIVVAAVGFTIWMVARVRHRGKSGLLAELLSPQSIAFIVVCAVAYLLTLNSSALRWDELRLWAAYPKILKFDGSLQLGGSAALFSYMQPYVPGMPLLGFFLAFFGEFKDSTIFFAYSVFVGAMMMPITRLLRWRRIYLVPIVALAIVLSPLVFWNSQNDGDFFTSLFVDPILGFAVGFACYLIAINIVAGQFGTLILGITAAAIYLIKESGAALGVILILAGLFQLIRIGKSIESPRMRAIMITRGALALWLPMVLVWASWRILITINGVNPGLVGAPKVNLDASLALRFIKALITEPVLRGWNGGSYSFAFFAVLLAVIASCIYFLLPSKARIRRARTDYLTAAIALLVVNVVFVIGMYLLFAGPFGGILASYGRYMSTPLTASFVFLVLTGARIHMSRMSTAKAPTVVGAALATVMLVAVPFRVPASAPPEMLKTQQQGIENARTIAAGISRAESGSIEGSGRNVFIVASGDVYQDALLHHQTYYHLLGNGALVKNFYLETDVTTSTEKGSPNYDSDVATARDNFSDALDSEDINFVFVQEASPELASQFGDYFSSVPETGTLFKVSRSGDLIKLVRSQ